MNQLNQALSNLRQIQKFNSNLKDSKKSQKNSKNFSNFNRTKRCIFRIYSLLGQANPNQRGIHFYNIQGSQATTNLVLQTEPNNEILSICFNEKLNSLFFHTVKGEVKRIDSSNSVHRVVQVNPMEEGAEICPGSTLKENRAGTDVLVLATHNKIMAMVNVAHDGFESGVSINGLDGHPFSNFKPFGVDMVFGLSKTGMISIHNYSDMSAAVIHTLLLPERIPHTSPLTTIVFDICAKDKYALISSHNEEMNREKLILVKLGGDFEPTIDTVHDFGKDDPSGDLISSINMDFYCDGGPLAVCSELEGKKRIEAFHIMSINKVFENPNSSLGFSLKRKGRNLFSVDDEGNISKVEVLPGTPYPSGYQNRLRDSGVQRSTNPGVLVSAGVTPSRKIGSFEPRPLKYSRNPEPRVISRQPIGGSVVSGVTPIKDRPQTFRNTAPVKKIIIYLLMLCQETKTLA